MKLSGWVPRLTRRQRMVRNLTAVVVVLLLAWSVLDFPAPTLEIAARWKAAQYGLPAPEVLYSSDGEGGDVILRWGDGRLALTGCYTGTLGRNLGDLWFTEPEDGGALLVPNLYDPDYTVYFWTEQTDAVQAEAALRIRTGVQVRISDSEGSSQEASYDWDETYRMEAEPDRQGFCRFEIPLKYDEDDFPLRAAAERSTLQRFSWAAKTKVGVDGAADFTVSFYDENGLLLDTWEKELYNNLREEELS